MNLVATLFPENPTGQHEADNLELLVRDALAESARNTLAFWVASAHAGALECARHVFERTNCPHWRVLPTEFRFDPAMNERRAHEISHGKQRLTRAWEEHAWDWIAFYDADVELSLRDILTAAAGLTPRKVVKFPYAVRDAGRRDCPPAQFGVYVQPGSARGYADAIYAPFDKVGRLVRNEAPDCNIGAWFRRNGFAVDTAAWARTRHWLSRDAYRQQWAGCVSEHRRVPGWGFDPVIDGHALDVTSMTFMREFLIGRPVRTALDLGTGSGNGVQLLLDCGAGSILSIDQDRRWQEIGMRQASLHPRAAAVEYRTVKLDADRSYDFGQEFAEPFDVVLVDGPCNDPPARIANVRKVPARCYAFHDGNRDRALIEAFADTRPGYRRQVSTAGRGTICLWDES